MNSLYKITHSIFNWCHQNSISISLARPKFSREDFINTDLDVIIYRSNIDRVIASLSSNYKLTCKYTRTDGITCHFYDHEEKFFFHIDFIFSLQIRGIEYLNINDVLNRAYIENGISYLDPIDQFLVLILTSKLKHKNMLSSKYGSFLKETIYRSPYATLEILQKTLGTEEGTRQYDDILQNKNSLIPFLCYFINSWKINGLVSQINILHYFIRKLYYQFKMPVYIIAFLGVDGAGKTTLINSLRKEIKEIVPIIKHAHFIPALPWKKEVNSNAVLNDPHSKNNRSYFLSCIKLDYYLCRYWLIYLTPRKTPVLYLYDRYIYDLLVDTKRYRFGGPEFQTLKSILQLFPVAKAVVFLNVSAQLAQSRKQEVTVQETTRQINLYREIISTLPNPLLLKADLPIEKLTLTTKDHLINTMEMINVSGK